MSQGEGGDAQQEGHAGDEGLVRPGIPQGQPRPRGFPPWNPQESAGDGSVWNGMNQMSGIMGMKIGRKTDSVFPLKTLCVFDSFHFQVLL